MPAASSARSGGDLVVTVYAREAAGAERAPGVGVPAGREPSLAEAAHFDARRVSQVHEQRVGAAGPGPATRRDGKTVPPGAGGDPPCFCRRPTETRA